MQSAGLGAVRRTVVSSQEITRDDALQVYDLRALPFFLSIFQSADGFFGCVDRIDFHAVWYRIIDGVERCVRKSAFRYWVWFAELQT